MITVDIARGYLRRGWCPIPVQFKSKKPNTPDWQHMRLREDDLEGAFSGKISIGVVLGPPSQRLDRRRPRLPRGNRNRAVHVAKDRRNLRTPFRPRVALALLFLARLQGGEARSRSRTR